MSAPDGESTVARHGGWTTTLALLVVGAAATVALFGTIFTFVNFSARNLAAAVCGIAVLGGMLRFKRDLKRLAAVVQLLLLLTGVLLGLFFSVLLLDSLSPDEHVVSPLPPAQLNTTATQKKQIDVSLISYAEERLRLEGCEQESVRIIKCRLRSRDRNVIDADRLTASAYKYDSLTNQTVYLPNAIVRVSNVIGASLTEATLIVPDGTVGIFLSLQ